MIASGLKRGLAAAVMLAGLVVTPGCISLLPETTPSTIYRLAVTGADMAPVGSEGGEVLLIERPVAPRGLAGDRIALDLGGGQIGYMAAAAWIAPAPDLIQELVLDTFDLGLDGVVAARPDDGVRSDYTLRLELRHFEAEYDQGPGSAPRVHVALRVRIIDETTRTLAGVTTVEGWVRASSNRQAAIIAAFGEAASNAAAELTAWAGPVLEAARAESAG